MDLVIVGSHFGQTTVASAPLAQTLPETEQGVPAFLVMRAGSSRGNGYDKIQRALAALDAQPHLPHGAETARDLLRTWLMKAGVIVTETKLLPNYPNPFNPETWIPYQLASDAAVHISIYDIKGTLVRQLALGHRQAGYYTNRSRAAHWDGRSEMGEQVSSGVYFYQLRTGDFTGVGRMVIVK
ncbi:MAG: T9SS type A sorting domain-containing protein [Candidatus Poribacteria bacterium]|nr:T9SS type A sorting domain-containing protein [Candidatus Poribacteria bacterium]